MVETDKSSQVAQRTIELCISLAVILLNIVEIVIISRLKRRKRIYEMLLLSLSVADLLFGISNGILCAVYLSDSLNYEVFEVTYTTYFYFVLTSILHLSWIALDRLLGCLLAFQTRCSRYKKKDIQTYSCYMGFNHINRCIFIYI